MFENEKKSRVVSLSLSLSRNHSMSIIMATLSGAERFPSSYSSPTCRRRSRPFRRVFPWIVCVAYVGLCRLLFQFTILNDDVCCSRSFALKEKRKVAPKFPRRTTKKGSHSFLKRLTFVFMLRATLRVARNLRFLSMQSEETSIIVTIITNVSVKQLVYVPRNDEVWKLDISLCKHSTICKLTKKNSNPALLFLLFTAQSASAESRKKSLIFPLSGGITF